MNTQDTQHDPIAALIAGLAESKRNEATSSVVMSRTTPVISITPDRPWSHIPMPESVGFNITSGRVAYDDQRDSIRLVMPDGSVGPEFTEEGIRSLGHLVGYRTDFIRKLMPATRVTVINEMIMQHRDQIIQCIGHNGEISTIAPGWRDVVGHSEIIETAYNALRGSTLAMKQDVDVRSIDQIDSATMVCKIMANKQSKITAKKGDVLRAGIKIEYRYASLLKVSLYIERLICENGMESGSEVYTWTNNNKGVTNIVEQLDYITMAIADCSARFDAIVNRSIQMSETVVEGDPRNALLARARAMKIDPKYTPDILQAFDAEEGNTEWHMLNAITRFATHSKVINDLYRTRVQSGAGVWVDKFDLVNCRMPRPIAEKFGAQIMEESNA